MHILSGKDAALIANSLRIAASQYQSDADEVFGQPRLAAQFERQARTASWLADKIDAAACLTLTEAVPSEEV